MATPTLPVSTTYIQWALAKNRGIMAHLYQFTAADGAQDYFTDFDQAIVWNGQTWFQGNLVFEGLQRKLAVGLAVDEQTLKIWAAPTATMFNANFLTGVEQGLLDGAVIVRYRAIWEFVTGNVAEDVQLPPLAVWPLFTGYTAQVTKAGPTHVELKVKSALTKLNVNMPRNYYQAGCLWTLFDGGCTLAKASFAVAGAVGSGATATTIPITGGIATPTGADGIAQYAQGRLLFNSGVNANLEVLVDSNDAANLYLAYPLTNVPRLGDSITYYPGCSKAHNTCDVKYNNENNYRGFDKVPPIVVSV